MNFLSLIYKKKKKTVFSGTTTLLINFMNRARSMSDVSSIIILFTNARWDSLARKTFHTQYFKQTTYDLFINAQKTGHTLRKRNVCSRKPYRQAYLSNLFCKAQRLLLYHCQMTNTLLYPSFFTTHGLDDPEFESQYEQQILIAKAPTPGVRPTQPSPTLRVQVIFPGSKAAGA
jgi:hypothetical protein